MYLEKLVESIIRKAQIHGELDNLPGQGKLVDLTEYFNTLEDVRVAQAMLKNAGMVSVEVELLQEITALKELILSMSDEAQKTKWRKTLESKQLQFDLLMERRQHKSRK